MADVDFDTGALMRALEEKALHLTINAKAEELRLAEEVAQRARQIAEPHRRTGAEEESIQVSHGEAGIEIHAKSYREFGTSKMKAEPFMRPAIAEAPGKFKPPSF